MDDHDARSPDRPDPAAVSELACLGRLAEFIPMSIMLLDAADRVVFVNRWHLDVFAQGKLPASFFLGKRLAELPGLMSAGVTDALQAMSQGKRVFMDEVFIPRFASGRSGYQRIRGVPLHEGERRLGGMLIREDVTAQVLARRALQEAETKYRAIFDTAPLGIFRTSLDGKLLECNHALAALLGYSSPREAMASILDMAQSCYADPAQRQEIMARLRQTDGVVVVDVDGLRRGGDRFIATVHAQLVRDEHGRPLYIDGMALDVTASRQAERALREASQAAETANASKSAFLACLSHDARVPLHHVLGMTELAMTEAVSPTQRDCLRHVRQAAEHLLALVDDMLDLSRIEAGRLEMRAESFSLSDLAQECLDLFRLECARKGLRLEHALDPALALPRCGDAARVRQVLVNLLGNAVKFTQAGEVRLEIGAERGGTAVQCTVSDTGPGIPRHRQETIFEPFVQCGVESAPDRSGAGLGLAISRRLVEAMGGRLELESAPGQGSRFSFTIDLPSADGQPPPRGEPAQSPLPRRVLVVEDDAVSRLYCQQVLHAAGVDARLAGSGQLALDLLASEPFEAVIMDMRMPDLDGVAVTRQLRQSQGWATPSDAPVVAVTAEAMRGDRERILAAGVDAYLAKPMNREALLHALRTARQSSAARKVSPAGTVSPGSGQGNG